MVSLVICCILLFLVGGIFGGLLVGFRIVDEINEKEERGEIIFVEKVDN